MANTEEFRTYQKQVRGRQEGGSSLAAGWQGPGGAAGGGSARVCVWGGGGVGGGSGVSPSGWGWKQVRLCTSTKRGVSGASAEAGRKVGSMRMGTHL